MDRPTGSSHAAFTMAALCGVAGAAGYAKSKSTASLAAGLGIAALYSAGGYQINSGRPDVGHPLALVASIALVGAMAPRYLKTKKAWPAGVMAVAGALNVLYQGRKTQEWLS
ncbi:UPF0136 domain isoform B [Chlorella sorokiniana]|uniref:UPF0136 domain isoform A n=1 Tax=Chlorella sorokiniana TaxID=3076 RepID=A0A2P6TLM4_CHLSO|nr:UPF0136 domain isoform A [Chlorella sorokiniana]PRW45198.1 UPF0136 domain isoform B [Chlorella sorokiniana]|eukprot:PRW45197.1 UPF0136 domain isoform A [Chlorella sorokiniana]